MNNSSGYKCTKKIVCLTVIFLILMMQAMPAQVLAGTTSKKVQVSSASVYKSPSSDAKVLGKAKKGTTVKIYEIRGDWAKVTVSGKKGFMNKSAFATTSKSKSKYRHLETGDSGSDVKALQKRLYSKGYLKKSAVNGKYGSDTKKAVRLFQLQNGLTINGEASESMQKKLFSSSAKSKKNVVKLDWFKGGKSVIAKKGTATIVDIGTGIRLNIRRVGGSNHADVEPKTAEDTAKLKKIYGSWSWDCRPVILIAGGKYIAASINGMPHGAEISTTNNFDGQFCLHLLNSKTHDTDNVQNNHQACIKAAYKAFN